MQVSPFTDNPLSLLFEVVVTSEHLAGVDIFLDMREGTIFNKPFRLSRIDLHKVVVDALIEGGNMWDVLL